MINALITGIMNIVISLVGVILTPIDNLINSSIPSLSSMFNFINNAFNIVIQFFGWIIDASLIHVEVVGFIVLILTFRLTIPLSVYLIKLAIRWYDKLKV